MHRIGIFSLEILLNTIVVYPKFRALYYGYYLLGLSRLFPRAKIVFSRHSFPEFHDSQLAFIIDKKRVLICAEDKKELNEVGLEWCDICGKVNIHEDQIGPRVMAIGPNFGIRFLSLWRSAFWALESYTMAKQTIKSGRRHFGDYYHQAVSRSSEDKYQPGESRDDYIFFVSSLWKREPDTNIFRANFIRACQDIKGLQFEGGLVSRPDVHGFSDITIQNRVSNREFLRKTRVSLAVFNTPAVLGCLGWKLGEYLAMGKAIITTPIYGALPAPLQHGAHAHFVDGSPESIVAAIHLLKNDRNYRMSLESAAKQYYQDYLEPAKVMKRVLERVGISTP